MRAEDFLKNRRWINGPEFLCKSKEEWPKLDVELGVSSVDDPEIKRDLKVNAIAKDLENATNHLIHYFSSWMKLKTSVAWFLKVKKTLVLLGQKMKEFCASAGLGKEKCETQEHKVVKKIQSFKATLKGQSLTPEDLAEAEWSIIQYVQRDKFKAEIASLKSDFKNVTKESLLYKLDPVMDGDVLRVGGRLSKAALPAESKHPAILSKDLHVSTLIMRHIHFKLGHAGRNHMLSSLRRKY